MVESLYAWFALTPGGDDGIIAAVVEIDNTRPLPLVTSSRDQATGFLRVHAEHYAEQTGQAVYLARFDKSAVIERL